MNGTRIHKTSEHWPNEGVTQVPYGLYDNSEIYARERERLFLGPTWNVLGFACEVPNPGDYKTTTIGDIPVVLVRGKDGSLKGFENRCSHRGSLLCLERFGNAKAFTCVYHAWSYDEDGNLVGVAFQNGVGGEGGMPDDFRREEHGLRRLKIASLSGLVFGSFDFGVPDLDDYLGPDIVARIRRVLPRPVKILGYYTQTLRNNWKLYAENVKDPYHASILHSFFTTFRVNRLSQQGGIIIDGDGAHHVSYSKLDRPNDSGHGDQEYEAENLRADKDDFGLKDPTILGGQDEFDDGITLQILTVFPGLVLQQVRNSLVLRQIMPRGVDRTDLIWTNYGFEDDDPELTDLRLLQANFIGPAGFISMEDGAVGEFVQRALPGTNGETSVVKMGGDAVASSASRVTEASIRGFWKTYRGIMDI
ncbi:MAG: Rieske 2Fe-2S domain-containing protein [Rhodospirillaceae bacterium]|jgi:phenylpropionate dioxygenase-like ring-hydroxylating dioxygenase large terminal subunit|nr:Rieske 2Fe-2S domain-containing protein [Rhodospirillaceae bacterium]MBT3495315.1 Rieske 2Fe-2S domain-containing protein [Rhodospirillaceae bacterium]MBT3781958.1 Rieske 2Fe-2S domain-containing protein [Rhodospirillaceae bacterium]MBT3979624.1 Rieske 2Fe-2S domain-containing protein [Rhodospirillaceae bacterium]MBT4166824.1 Rieske 2Fe-2S domain-containing protein [Rhodospirillaceae bacterium]